MYLEEKQKKPLKFRLNSLKIRIITFLTLPSRKISYLKKIEVKAKKIAKLKQLPFEFQCRMRNQKGRTSQSIGYIDNSDLAVDNLIFYIYSPYVMAHEDEILKTIFHEYCHFLFDYVSINTTTNLIMSYVQNKNFLKLTGSEDFTEDFCEIFAMCILDPIQLDQEIIKIINQFMKEAIFNIERKRSFKKFE